MPWPWILAALALAVVAVLAVRLAGRRTHDRATREVIDAHGHAVQIPATVRRVACPGATNQILLMLGAADRIAATASVVHQNPWFVRAYPAILQVPAAYGISSPVVSVETLLATRPDVVFGTAAQQGGMRVPVVELSLEDADGIKRSVKVVGQVLGGGAIRRADEYVAYYDDVVRRVREGTNEIPPERRIRAMTATGRGFLQTDGKRSIATTWIEAGGGVNVAAASVPTTTGNVTLEDVLRWDPEVVFTMSVADRDGVLGEPHWANVTAVKRKQVYVSPRGVYHWAVRSGEGALMYLWAAQTLHPDRFQTLDLEQETRVFYRRFYGMEISSQDVDTILHPAK